jgi:asparagine synthase (glutamine-hydrolysing)
LETFSVGFRFGEFNELPLARHTAERYRTKHHEIIVDDTDTAIVEELARHFDEPFGDPSAVPTYYISREARRFVKVVLSGDGGDEVFGGYTHYLEALAYARVDRVPSRVRHAVFGTLGESLPERLPGVGLMRRLAVDGPARYQRQLGVFDGIERRRLLRPEFSQHVRDSEFFDQLFDREATDLLAKLQVLDQQTYLPEDVLVKVDRAAMKNALEVRVPFLDHRIVEFANALPASLKIRGTTQKYILRKVATPLVPAAILSGAKRGFGIPIKHWFRGELKGAARDLLLSNGSVVSAFFERQSVVDLLDNHERGGRDFSDRIWALVVLEQWYRGVARGHASSPPRDAVSHA